MVTQLYTVKINEQTFITKDIRTLVGGYPEEIVSLDVFNMNNIVNLVDNHSDLIPIYLYDVVKNDTEVSRWVSNKMIDIITEIGECESILIMKLDVDYHLIL